MSFCPECARAYPAGRDICPACWERLQPGKPRRGSSLALVFETNAFYEADMLETLLQNEGIPCLKIPSHGALLWPAAISWPRMHTRLYVRADTASAARALIAEVTGGWDADA